MRHASHNRGFIALMSMLLLSAVLAMLIFSTSTSTFFARFNTLDRENKRLASGLAESCTHLAILYLTENYSYDPVDDPLFVSGKGVPKMIKDGTCFIESVLPHAPRSGNHVTVTILTKGIYQNSISVFQVTADVKNPTSNISSTDSYITIVSWKEVL